MNSAIITRFMADTGDQRQAASGQSSVGTGVFPVPPVIPSGEEVYDSIMGGIEPELVTTVLPTLKEKYKDETPAAAKARAERYEKAFAEYDKRYAQYIASQQQGIQTYEKQFMQGVQKVAAAAEASQLDDISSQIASL